MIKLNLKFKGARKYLQGADIFNAASKNLSEIYPESFISNLVLKSFTKNEISIYFDKYENNNKSIGYGSIKLNNEKIKKFWIKETNVKVTSSYDFSEEQLLNKTILNNNQISVMRNNNYTIMESIIILTKKINYKHCPLIDGKWVFSQIKLEKKLPNYWEKIDINLKEMKNNIYSQNKIIVDSKIFGELIFMVAKL